MKRFWIFALTAILTLGLGACGSPNASQQDVSADLSPEEQIGLMAAGRGVWLLEEPEYPAFYAVTDINGNGRLELLRSQAGDGWNARDAFFEVSADGNALQELAFPFGEDHSHPDLMDWSDYAMYIGQEGRYLVVTDNIYMGPVQASDYQAYHVLDYLHFGEGEVEGGDIAWAMVMDEDTNGDTLKEMHIYYYGSEDSDVERDGSWYVAAPGEKFYGYDQQICHMAWSTLDTYDAEAAPSEEALKESLTELWDAFSVESDPSRFAELIRDPFEDFYAGGAGGILYRPGDEVPYFPSFRDLYGTWYLQYAWTDAGTWYVGKELSNGELNILEDGQLYADYANEADPRGPYLITEMKMTRDSKADGTAKDDWVIVYESDDRQWEMQLRPDPENDALNVTWYEWEDGSRSGDPTGMNLVYSRIAG